MADNLDEPAAPAGGGGLVRLRLDLGYDGTDFSGWAMQPGLRTVQEVLETALGTLFHLDRSERTRLVVAGRTDAGVHATGQVAHLDVPVELWQRERGRIIRRLAGLLPADLRVYAIAEAGPGFDARFSALWRRYRYRISDADCGPQPLERLQTVGWKRRLDVAAMHQAGQQLVGLNDFAAFCRRRAGASTVRCLQWLTATRTGGLIEIELQADAFCHSMVRSVVGALAAVGEAQRATDWPAQLLSLSQRSDEVTVAPARGLTLLAVGYPDDDQLAARAAQTRAVRTLDPAGG